MSQEILSNIEQTIGVKQKIDAVLNQYIEKKKELIAIERQLEVLTNESKLMND